ncbi:hypothetical protein MASR2M70_16860 [Bacillota bacterium]
MGRGFDYFVEKIPINIHNNTRTTISEHIAIFIPNQFVTDTPLIVEEYHFVICFTTPPPVTINDIRHQFKKGCRISMIPGDVLLVHPAESSFSVKYITLCVNKEFMQDIYRKSGGIDGLSFRRMDNTYSSQLLEAADALINEILNFGNTNPLMIESLESRIAVQLLRDCSSDFTVYSGEQQYLRDLAEKAAKYIESYYSSNIINKDICDAIYISPPHLQRVFLKYMKKTPYQYIMECRHKKAKEMLETTNSSVGKISRLCGFVNSSHFSSSFKQREGISPTAYRKALAQQK